MLDQEYQVRLDQLLAIPAEVTTIHTLVQSFLNMLSFTLIHHFYEFLVKSVLYAQRSVEIVSAHGVL